MRVGHHKSAILNMISPKFSAAQSQATISKSYEMFIFIRHVHLPMLPVPYYTLNTKNPKKNVMRTGHHKNAALKFIFSELSAGPDNYLKVL